MILYILQGWGRVQLPGSKVQEHCMGNNARFQFTLCFLSLFPVTYIQFIFLLQMKVCQLRHQDAETLMTMVAARFLPGWRVTKRRRRKMACVCGEVSFYRTMLWTVMNWWNLGGCCAVSFQSWAVAHTKMTVGGLGAIQLLLEWDYLCVDW